ncbi:MAG: family acetyltransferase [Bacteroidetes bacterium]|nr:family acetyltransferase [Bacteroidota bacterium]
MQIKTYNSAQLNDLILSDEFRTMPVIPISTHRAISHIRNPRVDPDDVLMIIMYDYTGMVGYLGVLADRIYNSAGEEFKCGWLSCMWVDPEQRGKGIAKQLLNTAFKSWNDHILVTEFTPEAKGLYDRSGNFNALRSNDGLRCYLRFNLHEVLPKKNEKYKPYSSLLKLVDAVANIPVDVKLKRLPPLKYSQHRFEPVSGHVRDDVDQFIRSFQAYSFERRDVRDLNWIMEYPWLVQSGTTEESHRYHFSSVADRFQNLSVKMMDGDRMIGFLHLTIRDNHLKMPYAFISKENVRDVMEYIYDVMLTLRLNMLTVFHKDIVAYLQQNSNSFIYKRPIKRNYIITKKLDAHFADKDKLIIQDGDADCAFT